MKKYKALVFFDLDGTLLDSHSKISIENRQLILALKQNSILPIIASGRSPKEIKQITEGTGIDSYVSLNGQFNVVENTIISKHIIPTKRIHEIMQFSKTLNHALACYTENKYAASYVNNSMKRLYQLDHAPLPQISSSFYKENEIYMLYLFSENPETDTLYRKKFAEIFTFFRDSPYSMAVVLNGASKKTGIQQIIEKLALNNLPTYAFGDGNNDIGMFDVVDTAIAMENASDYVKGQADFVTKSNVNGGIRFGLEQFNLIN